MLITELEIRAVGADFSGRTSWRANQGRAGTWKSENKCKNTNTFEKHKNRKNVKHVSK
jgi:hypothetical protein